MELNLFSDLKRFIVYENRYSNIEDAVQRITGKKKIIPTTTAIHTLEKLHISTTATSRVKSSAHLVSRTNTDKDEAPTEAIDRTAHVLRVRNQQSQTSCNNLRSSTEALTANNVLPAETRRRGTIPIPPAIVSAAPSVCSKSTETAATKYRTKLIRNTPTDLYQFYQKDWDRFRKYLPGENSRSSVRAEVRRRLEHQAPQKTKVYLRVGEDQKKTLTRL